MDTSTRSELLEKSLALQLQWISSADSKSSYIFTLALAMLGAIAASLPAPGQIWTATTVASIAVASLLLVAAVVCVINVVFPRTDGPVHSLLYCGSIRDLGVKRFREAIESASWQSHLEDLSTQVYRNACIASEKFQWVKKSVILLYLATPAWLIAIGSLYTLRE